MAFDQQTRNRLAHFVADTRDALRDEFIRQLQHEYGMDPKTGEVSDLRTLGHLDDSRRETAKLLRETMEHYVATSPSGGNKEALNRIVREQAFTILNRLCAIRMAEGRELVIESICKGYQSKGFQLYARLAGTALGERGDIYKQYLLSLFDEFAIDLPVLFDRFSPQGRLFPRENVLLKVLEEINSPDLESLWVEDETIGWIYQYFNSIEERRQMRAESQAPRNSRELAVRNQFFTPRYVVEFLTDNTLGRIWYEMYKGETTLKDECRYIVRRPNEVFLGPGETAPETSDDEVDLSQEELLKLTAYVEHRQKKDPRDLKVLDPACGSGHFLLYSFDLLERIYKESWEDEESPKSKLTGESLRQDYPSLDVLICEIPKLIVENNLYGIEIDPRCAQIAGLCVWLRAQKSWKDQGLKAAERPHIRKSGIVVAEAMPGEEHIRKEFLEGLRPRVLAQLVEVVFDKMKLAGEAGYLLKIEEEISSVVVRAKKQWQKAPKSEQKELFAFPKKPKVVQEQLFDLSGVTDEQFWEEAEEQILNSLQEYSALAENGNSSSRRLFANDVFHGFAFIELCRNKYDVVLMNPPFGDMPRSVYDYADAAYPYTKFDFHTAFLERALMVTSDRGYAAYISNRTWFSLYRLDGFRKHIVLGNDLQLVADLGLGVLDDALVEAACTVVSNSSITTANPIVFKLTASREKEVDLLHLSTQFKTDSGYVHLPSSKTLINLPRSLFGYWFPPPLARRLTSMKSLYPDYGFSRQGLATRNDFRFLRLRWEVQPTEVREKWFHFAKGGEYEPYYDDIHLLINFERDGRQLKSFITDVKGEVSWSRNIPSSDFYGRPGLTYPERTTSDFSPRPLSEGVIFSATGQAVFFEQPARKWIFLGLAYSRIYKQLMELFIGGGDATESGSAARHYTSGIINEIPFPSLSEVTERALVDLVKECVGIRMEEFGFCEEAMNFCCPVLLHNKVSELTSAMTVAQNRANEQVIRLGTLASEIDRHASAAYGLNSEDTTFLDEEVAPDPFLYGTRNRRDEFPAAEELNSSSLIELLCERVGYRRAFTKKAYWSDRRLELLAHLMTQSPHSLVQYGEVARIKYLASPVEDLLSYVIGVIFGRWDIRTSSKGNSHRVQLDPFEPLPLCPPACLIDSKGKPATSVDDSYPIQVCWNGIIANHQGHQDDIENLVREVFCKFWSERAESMEREICGILHVSDLREYYSQPNSFFDHHLTKYSKSRRYAPIYWLLSTVSGSYTLWLYYHRLTDQTLFTCVNDYVEPKLKQVSDDATRLRQKSSRSSIEERELTRLSDLELELKDFRDELLRLSKFWKPNLNDGVQITAAPLWKLFQHRQWQNKLKETWKKLKKGDFDWAHLAYSIWPDRVKEKCKKDKSLAIAHGMEDLYVEPQPKAKKSKAKK